MCPGLTSKGGEMEASKGWETPSDGKGGSFCGRFSLKI